MSSATVPVDSNSKKSILVVEDDESIMEILKYNLEREGYNVLCRSDGREGLDAALAQPPDLVVLDLMLPGIDGVEICRQLRQSPGVKTKPILMLSTKNFWKPLLTLIAHMRDQGFIRPGLELNYLVAERVEEVIPMLENAARRVGIVRNEEAIEARF